MINKMYNINIYQNQFIKDRIPSFTEEAKTFSEIIEVFEYYSKDGNSDKGHLINFWSSDDEKYTNGHIQGTNILPIDMDVHKEFNSSLHYINSLKYIWTYEEVKRILDKENLSYIMYKTKSYGYQKDCFRVVLDLKETISFNLMENYREHLKEVNYDWRSLDPASLANQLFQLPFNPSGGDLELDYNIGRKFDMLADNWLFPEYHQVETVEDEDFIICNENGFNDVSGHKSIKFYLNTSFNKKSGNGNSSTSLFVALSIAKKNGDDDTLNKIISKAKCEKWSSKEIQQKLNSVKR